ncbi:MAG: DUF1838 family protein [Aeromicrobium sp.]|nr:DUF1838 family protein [Burkholderiales bacterium]
MKLSKLVMLCSAAAMISISPLASAQKPAAPAKLDINNPDDVAKMDRKMQSSLKDGEEIVYYWEGNVYTRIAGEKDRQLFTYYGMNIRTSKGFQDPVKGYGWRHVSREVLFYLDPVTKQVVRTWKNPWTGEELDVQHVANDPVNGRGISWARGESGPVKFRGRESEDKFIFTNEYPLFYSNPLAGDYQEYVGGTYQAMEIFNFIVDKDDLLDATKTTTYPGIAWTRISKFLPWMKMGDRQGYMIFSGTGKKLRGGYAAMPEPIRKEIETNWPIYKSAPPTDDTRPNETSWTDFKKILEKKKAAAQAKPAAAK